MRLLSLSAWVPPPKGAVLVTDFTPSMAMRRTVMVLAATLPAAPAVWHRAPTSQQPSALIQAAVVVSNTRLPYSTSVPLGIAAPGSPVNRRLPTAASAGFLVSL